MALTKNEILQGTRARRSLPVPSLGGEVKIRPLTDGEYHETQMIFIAALDLSMQVSGKDLAKGKEEIMEMLQAEFDIVKFTDAEHDMNLLATAYGLSVDDVTWTVEEVTQLPPGAVEEIAEAVFELSGSKPEQEDLLRRFREIGSGSRDHAHSDAGDPAGQDAIGADTGSADRSVRDGQADVHSEGATGA